MLAEIDEIGMLAEIHPAENLSRLVLHARQNDRRPLRLTSIQKILKRRHARSINQWHLPHPQNEHPRRFTLLIEHSIQSIGDREEQRAVKAIRIGP